MSKKMSRRSFLKMTAAGAVGAAGMGVFAPLSAIAEEKQTAADESGIQWDLKADIIVLGAGGAEKIVNKYDEQMRYVQTLIHEMEESAADWADVRVGAVRLVGGGGRD